MIILNLELGEELEKEFYKKISRKKISYLKYVEELIINDLRSPYQNSKEDLLEPIKEIEEIENLS